MVYFKKLPGRKEGRKKISLHNNLLLKDFKAMYCYKKPTLPLLRDLGLNPPLPLSRR